MPECCVRCGNTEFLLDHVVVNAGLVSKEIVCYLCAEEEFMEAA